MAIVTKENVFAAAQTLTEAGLAVTQNAVRKELGGGSYSSIGDLLTAWRQAQTTSQTPPPLIEPVPAALTERLQGLLTEAWTQALATANERMKAEREALAMARAELEAEKADAVAFADGVSTELEAALAQIQELTAAAKIAADKLAGTQQQLAKSEADHMATQAAKAELATVAADLRKDQQMANANIARLTGELKAAETQAAAEQRASAAAEQRASEATAKADKASSELARNQAELAGEKARAKAAETAAASAKAEASAGRTAERESRTKAMALQLKLDALTSQAQPPTDAAK